MLTLKAKLFVVTLLVFASVGVGFLTMIIQTGTDAVMMRRDGVTYVKTVEGGWVASDSPMAPLFDAIDAGYRWTLDTVPMFLPGTSGQCGEDSGIDC